ncbi:MAG: ATP-binding protein [Patulibacter sp.]|nr:ATP-binding protein [Patulibacter sp.]
MADLFDDVQDFPDPQAQDRYDSLVGLDRLKEMLARQAKILIRPDLLESWSEQHFDRTLPAVRAMRRRPPLFLFAGDVGTGKSTLAETFGDRLARDERVDVQLLRLSLSSRGQGSVGEMTALITRAFAELSESVPKPSGKPKNVGILLIDEADAIAQSRDAVQMHHEDRAGVNALIRGVDAVALSEKPIITVLCTNRLDAIDPAVRRRAFGEYLFERPSSEQRRALMASLFEGVELTDGDLDGLAELTGEGDRSYGATWSDLTVRFVSAAILDAFPSEAITGEQLLRVAKTLPVTPPFGLAQRA